MTSFMEHRALSRWVDRIEARDRREAKRYPKTRPAIYPTTMEGRAEMARLSKRRPVECSERSQRQ